MAGFCTVVALAASAMMATTAAAQLAIDAFGYISETMQVELLK